MSAAILLNTGEIRRLQFRAVSPSKFVQLGRTLHRAAKIIKREWNNFSPDDRKLLKEFAYELIQPQAGLLNRLWAELYMLFIRLTGQEKEFLFCLDALDCLTDAILDAIERENPDYQQVLFDTLKELTSSPKAEEPIDGEQQRCERLQRVSDRTSTEI